MKNTVKEKMINFIDVKCKKNALLERISSYCALQACCHLIKGWIPFQIAHTPSLFGLSSCEYTVLCVACQIRHASSSSPWFIKCFRVAYFFSLLEIYLYVICLYLFYSRYWNKAFEMLIKWALENVMNFQALYWNHKVSKIILDLITI